MINSGNCPEPIEQTGLSKLIHSCDTARTYFSSLPDYVQGAIQQRADNICTEEDLHSYADNLLAGDQ